VHVYYLPICPSLYDISSCCFVLYDSEYSFICDLYLLGFDMMSYCYLARMNVWIAFGLVFCRNLSVWYLRVALTATGRMIKSQGVIRGLVAMPLRWPLRLPYIFTDLKLPYSYPVPNLYLTGEHCRGLNCCRGYQTSMWMSMMNQMTKFPKKCANRQKINMLMSRLV
jgi:hypothetical protein